LEFPDGPRLDRISEREAEDFRIEVELSLERALDVLRNPETVLLALKGNVGDRHTLLAQRGDNELSLVGRHDLVLQPLEEDHRRGDPLDRVDRRPLAIDVPILRPRAQQALVVHRLELVRVAVKDFQVADAEMARPGFEEICGGQGSQDRVAAGAPAGDRHTVTVDQATFDQVAGPVDGVVDVDDAPLAVEALPVLTAEPRAPTVVHDQVTEAAGGPELVANVERIRHRTRRAAVDVNDERREFAG